MADTRKQADEAAKAQEALEMEVSRCLMGQSQFTAEMLSKLIEQAAQKHKALNHTAAELEQKAGRPEENCRRRTNLLRPLLRLEHGVWHGELGAETDHHCTAFQAH